MPDRCVVFGCSNESDLTKGISLHRIPFWNDDRAEAKRRRKVWVNFVAKRRDKWKPTKYSAVCSAHFNSDDYAIYAIEIPGTKDYTPRLKKDDIGVMVFPTIYKICDPVEPSPRDKRQAAKERAQLTRDDTSVASLCQPREKDSEENPSIGVDVDQFQEITKRKNQFIDAESQTYPAPCIECASLKNINKKLRNNWVATKHKLKLCRHELKSSSLSKTDYHKLKQQKIPSGESQPPKEATGNLVHVPVVDCEMDSDLSDDEESEDEDEEMYVEETDEDTISQTDSDDEKDARVYVNNNDNVRVQPKFIVFLSQLLILFKFCPFCNESNPQVETRQLGTMAVIKTTCTNSNCRKEFSWKSQPVMPGTKIPAGNFLLCFAVLLAGSSASKIIQIFHHMGLACISLNTYFKHQRKILLPSILLHWKKYQQELLDKAKAAGSGLVIAGDGRHDSMGHSAKYCSYTIFSCTASLIIHFALVQRNEAGSSPAMEYMAFEKSMTFLLGIGLTISTFISDRHLSIAKHMKEKLSGIKHYFDLWHLKKKITKIVTTISKESGCQAVLDWIKPCGNHLYWSACSTHDGNGQVIWAKFKSFLSHIVNKHEKLDDPLFNRCAHAPTISHREYLVEGSVAHEKLCTNLTKSRLVSAIQKASPISQTSCLEGFHSVLNQFSPKMINYSFPGMYCRHILAAIHFNYNLHRKIKNKKDGSQQIKVVYPKFKNGEGTVRDIRVQPNFDYVDEVFQTIVTAIKKTQLESAFQELKSMTPSHMNTMLEKQSREEALKKRDDRRLMTLPNVPPTTPVSELPTPVPATQPRNASTRSKPHCVVCKQPMKGHKNVTDCPKNRRVSTST